MKKLYLVHWTNGEVTPCNSMKEVDYLKEVYPETIFKKIEIYELDDTPFDMYQVGIKKTWCYCGTEKF